MLLLFLLRKCSKMKRIQSWWSCQICPIHEDVLSFPIRNRRHKRLPSSFHLFFCAIFYRNEIFSELCKLVTYSIYLLWKEKSYLSKSCQIELETYVLIWHYKGSSIFYVDKILDILNPPPLVDICRLLKQGRLLPPPPPC